MDYGYKVSLKAARVNVGLSQEKAAEMLGICKKTLQCYEKGQTIPTWDVVLKMRDLYGIPIDFISFGEKFALSEYTNKK